MRSPCHILNTHFCLLLILLLLGKVSVCANEGGYENLDGLESNDIEALLDSISINSEDALLKLRLSEELASYYYKNNEFSNALSHYKVALKAAQQLQRNQDIYKHHYNIAVIYNKLGSFLLAIDYLKKLLKEIEAGNILPTFQAEIFGELSTSYLYVGEYTESSKYQLKALKIREELKDTLNIGTSYYTFGNMYYQQQNYEKAEHYYRKALRTWKLIKYEKGIYRCYAALGSVFGEIDDLEKSFGYNLMALDLAEELNDQLGISYALNNVGENYIEKDDFDAAEPYFSRALQIFTDIEDKNGQTVILESIGNLRFRQGRPQEALDTLISALQLAQEIGANPRILDIYYSISEYFDSQGNIKDAFRYKEKYIDLKSSLFNENYMERINQMQMDYDADKSKREKEFAELKQQGRLQNIYLMLGIAVLSLLIFLILIGFFKYKIRVKKRDLLQLEQTHIDKEKEHIQDSNEDLKQFVWVVAHDLKQPLRMITSYTHLLKNRLKKVVSPSSQQQFEEVEEEASRMGDLLNNLLEYSRLDQHEEMLTQTDVNEMVNIACNKQYQLIEVNKAQITSNQLPILRLYPEQFKKMLMLILQNSIKFRQKNTPIEININSEKRENECIIHISDNGIGIEENNLEGIFELFKRGHKNALYEGSGFGLGYCKKVMENHQGKIWASSELQKGTTISLSFPASAIVLESPQVNLEKNV